MHDVALVLFAAFALVLLLLPLPIHLRARNTSTLFNMTWLFIGNLNLLINSTTWWENADNKAPVFCDISVKLQTGLATGLAACSLCINLRLASIAASKSVSVGQKQKRINLAVDIALCVGLPMVVMALSYIVQPHRFDIVEGRGCMPSIWQSLPSVFLVYLWPLAIGLVSIIYGAIAMKFFLARRLQFQSLLKSSQSGLDTSRYFRLMAMASSDLILGMPLNIAFLVLQVQDLREWTSWSDIHYGWSAVTAFDQGLFDLYYGSPSRMAMSVLTQWLCPVLAILFFLFFGVGDDAIREYGQWYQSGRVLFGLPDTSLPTKPALFTPKLGSTVARPQGLDWNDSGSVKEHDAQSDSPFGDNVLPVLPGTIPHAGMSVAVHVEREVV